jgi:hypothetical protein
MELPSSALCNPHCPFLIVHFPLFLKPFPMFSVHACLFRRAAASVAVSGSTLELPPQEFQQLRQLAAEGAGQIVLKLASEYEWLLGSIHSQ